MDPNIPEESFLEKYGDQLVLIFVLIYLVTRSFIIFPPIGSDDLTQPLFKNHGFTIHYIEKVGGNDPYVNHKVGSTIEYKMLPNHRVKFDGQKGYWSIKDDQIVTKTSDRAYTEVLTDLEVFLDGKYTAEVHDYDKNGLVAKYDVQVQVNGPGFIRSIPLVIGNFFKSIWHGISYPERAKESRDHKAEKYEQAHGPTAKKYRSLIKNYLSDYLDIKGASIAITDAQQKSANAEIAFSTDSLKKSSVLKDNPKLHNGKLKVNFKLDFSVKSDESLAADDIAENMNQALGLKDAENTIADSGLEKYLTNDEGSNGKTLEDSEISLEPSSTYYGAGLYSETVKKLISMQEKFLDMSNTQIVDWLNDPENMDGLEFELSIESSGYVDKDTANEQATSFVKMDRLPEKTFVSISYVGGKDYRFQKQNGVLVSASDH